MSELHLTQEEAEKFLKEEKNRIDNTEYLFPESGGSLHIPLKTKDNTEHFMLDIRRANIELKKNTFQTRVRKEIVLVRLDLGGPPHRNPDGLEILCPHIHLYREGFGDKWAYPLPVLFTNPTDSLLVLEQFMDYCNIKEKPNIQRK